MRILFLIILVAIVAGAWWAVRHMAGDDDLAAVVEFSAPTSLREGDPVTLEGSEIGRVSAVESRGGGEAIRILIDGARRADVRADSVWRVERDAGVAVLVIDNRVAVGRPVEDGAVLRGGDDPAGRWMERGREWLGRIGSEVERLGSEADTSGIEAQFDEWTARIPEWKSRGEQALDGARAQIEPRMRDLERRLREAGRTEDADRVRRRLDEWLEKAGPDAPAEAPVADPETGTKDDKAA